MRLTAIAVQTFQNLRADLSWKLPSRAARALRQGGAQVKLDHEAEAEAPARLLRPVPPMGLAKDAREQELAVRLRDALLRRFRFNEYNDLGSRLHAGTDEWVGDWLPQAGGARESICVGDNVGGDRLCWTRVDKDGVKEFVVWLRLGGEGELVLQVFSVCTPGHFEETHGRREGWEDADRVYGLAIGWANA